MPFKKGQSGNPNGRPDGAKSEKTLAWEEMGQYIVNAGAERYIEIVKELPDPDFMNRFENLLEYFKPKLQRSENINEHKFIGSGLKIGYGDKGKL